MTYIRTTKQFMAQIKQARKDRGLTQKALGELVGMGQKKIAMLENLTASPRLDVLLILMSALGLNLIIENESKESDKKTNNIKIVWD
jgi:HTH-type transcriptional regulator/antitoxin HipB